MSDWLVPIDGGIDITGILSWTRMHSNVKLAWSLKESSRPLLWDLKSTVSATADTVILIGDRLDVWTLLEYEIVMG